MKIGLVAIALVLVVSLALFGCTQQAPVASPTPSVQPTASVQSAAEGEIDDVSAEMNEIDSLVGSLDGAEINDSDVNLS